MTGQREGKVDATSICVNKFVVIWVKNVARSTIHICSNLAYGKCASIPKMAEVLTTTSQLRVSM